MNKKKGINKLVLGMLLLCITAVTASFFIPDLLLKKRRASSTNHIYVAPESYYVESGNAMARNTSSNLTSLEQVKLISGVWESTGVECSTDQGFLTENEAVDMARGCLNTFYNIGVFPYASAANYNNWCSWDAKLYCYTDNLFNTYSAYLWVISFTKFDNSVTHTVYMTEKGVIVGAYTTDTDYKPSQIISAYSSVSVKSIFSDEDIQLLEKKKAPENTVINSVYPETDFSNVNFDQIYILDLISSDGQLESYYVYQYSSEDIYGIGILPCSNNP